MARRTGTGGRPSKGPRDQMVIRAPLPVGDAIRDRAEALGMTMSDYCSAVLARDVDMEDLAPMRTPAPPAAEQTTTDEVEAPTRRSA